MATSAFDVLNQSFNLTGIDGEVIEATTAEIQQLQHIVVSSGITFATQLGLSVAVLAILLLTAGPTKFRTPSLHVNALALLCNVFRCALQCAIQNSALSNFVIQQTGAYQEPGVRDAQIMSVACTLFTLALFMFIEISLFIQVKAVFASVRERYRSAVLSAVAMVAVVAVGWRINLAIANIRVAADIADVTQTMLDAQTWAQFVANITSIISIGASSLIFSGKIAHAIYARRKMGLKAFGTLQIVFIVGCQTLILPVIFAAIAYFALPGVQLQSFVDTFVALFLPLSSIWSSANVRGKLPAGHPRALLELPSHNTTLSHSRHSRTSDTSLSAPLSRPVPISPDHTIRRERSFWAQYGSRDSVMFDNLDTAAKGALVKQSAAINASRQKASQESG